MPVSIWDVCELLCTLQNYINVKAYIQEEGFEQYNVSGGGWVHAHKQAIRLCLSCVCVRTQSDLRPGTCPRALALFPITPWVGYYVCRPINNTMKASILYHIEFLYNTHENVCTSLLTKTNEVKKAHDTYKYARELFMTMDKTITHLQMLLADCDKYGWDMKEEANAMLASTRQLRDSALDMERVQAIEFRGLDAERNVLLHKLKLTKLQIAEAVLTARCVEVRTLEEDVEAQHDVGIGLVYTSNELSALMDARAVLHPGMGYDVSPEALLAALDPLVREPGMLEEVPEMIDPAPTPTAGKRDRAVLESDTDVEVIEEVPAVGLSRKCWKTYVCQHAEEGRTTPLPVRNDE